MSPKDPVTKPKTRPGNRLRTKLTGLFVLGTTLTTALVGLLIFGLLLIAVFGSDDLDKTVTADLEARRETAIRLFSGEKPDVPGLSRMLDQAILGNDVPAEGIQFSPYTASIGSLEGAITDANGAVLAFSPQKSSFSKLKKIQDGLSPEELKILTGALAGKTSTGRANGRIVACGSILVNGKVVGTAFVRSGILLDGWKTFRRIANEFLMLLILTAFVTLIVGGIIGHFFATKITTRLLGISATADQWAKGDLSVTAEELPADEIGQLARKLNGMAGDLKELISVRNTLATLEERQRITRDLHDTVKQEAFATAMMVSSAQQYHLKKDDANLSEALAEAYELARKMQTDLSTILMQLRADGIQASVSDALERISLNWARRSNLAIRVQRGGDYELAPGLVEQLTRITDEAVANAVKHSQGTTVLIGLHQYEGRYRLTVADNGVGMPGALTSAGMGMQTMRERAEMLPGGTFSIGPNGQRGTIIKIEFLEQIT